jgi:hypothetical protein
MDEKANPEVETQVDVQDTNLQDETQGTHNDTPNLTGDEAITIDYQKKFSESAKEAQRLYEENKRLSEMLSARESADVQTAQNTNDNNLLYPGFENLDDESRENIIAYTNAVKSMTKKELYEDPAIKFARKQYSETIFNNALEKTISEFPELAESREEFKNKYFNANNVPENIESILKDVAKIHLFDKAKTIGAKEAQEQLSRVDMERQTGGPKETTARRSAEDWLRLSQENPAQFAKLSKEFKDDLDSGKI